MERWTQCVTEWKDQFTEQNVEYDSVQVKPCAYICIYKYVYEETEASSQNVNNAYLWLVRFM